MSIEIQVAEPSAKISVITNTKGLLCKEFFVDANNAIAKVPHGNLYSGVVETRELSLSGLQSTIEELKANQAFALGVRKFEFEHISQINTTSNVIANHSIARSKDYFEFNENRSFMLLDYDDKELTSAELLEKIIEIIPEFKDVGMLLVPSSSAGVYRSNNEQPLDVSKASCHIYMIVERGSCIPEIGKYIKYRAWKSGLGNIKISSSGAMLERHLFDDAVYSPERLIFDASPILKNDLKQTPRVITHIKGGMIKC